MQRLLGFQKKLQSHSKSEKPIETKHGRRE
jgi:hypothetical protein